VERPCDYCLTRQAARILDLTPDGVRWLTRIGRLRPLVTTGGVRLFVVGDVVRLAAERRSIRRNRSQRGTG
jgi:hypothetical protein